LKKAVEGGSPFRPVEGHKKKREEVIFSILPGRGKGHIFQAH